MTKIVTTLMLTLVCGLSLVTVASAQITPETVGLPEAKGDFSDKDIRTTIADVIKVAMGFLGIIAVVIVLIGGFKWMTAGGNEEQVGEAKKWLFSGAIGLAIILSAYAIANFVIKGLITATTGA